MEKDPHPFEHKQDTQNTHVNADDAIVVPVTEEELAATARPVERGEVRVDKHVIEEHQTIDVPVTEKEVDVTRQVVNREVDPAGVAFEDETIRVPIHGEEVEVEKRIHVTEEINITKRVVTHNEQVTDTLRREEVVIDGEGEMERSDEADGPSQ
jgi:uncharacterized protein (TIGR02271 family)